MKTEQLLKLIESENKISEKHILLLKNRMNRGEKIDLSVIYDNEILLTDEQTEKGKKFLLNLFKSPLGKIRKNNPFGYREQEVLENLEGFTLKGFYNAGNRYIDNYIPLYEVFGKGVTFEYYYNGQINIVG